MYVIQNILQKISVTPGAFALGGLVQSLHEITTPHDDEYYPKQSGLFGHSVRTVRTASTDYSDGR